MNKLNIICTSDSKYLPITKVLLQSLYNNANNFKLYLRLVNCSSCEIDEIRSRYPDCIIQLDKCSASERRTNIHISGIPLQESNTFKPKISTHRSGRWLYSDLMAYCSNIKFETITKLLSQEDIDNFFYIDADSIIRKDFVTDILKLLEKYGSVFRFEPMPEEIKFRFERQTILYHGGMFGALNTPVFRELFGRIYSDIKQKIYDWDVDEYSIYNRIKQLDITPAQLPKTYKDEGTTDTLTNSHQFKSNSHIWCGAGNVKYTCEMYVNEAKKYNIKY